MCRKPLFVTGSVKYLGFKVLSKALNNNLVSFVRRSWMGGDNIGWLCRLRHGVYMVVIISGFPQPAKIMLRVMEFYFYFPDMVKS